jgi:hypothetical protein
MEAGRRIIRPRRLDDLEAFQGLRVPAQTLKRDTEIELCLCVLRIVGDRTRQALGGLG